MIVICSVAYNRRELVTKSLDYFYATHSRSEFDRHILYDPGYPLPDKETNSEWLKKTAKDFGIEYQQIQNDGCHKNWDKVSKEMNLGEGDYFIPVCADTHVADSLGNKKMGWVTAMVDVMKADPDCFTVQCIQHAPEYFTRPHIDIEVGGHKVKLFSQLVAWSSGGFNMGLVKQVGGFSAYSERYGYVEQSMADKLIPIGKRYYILSDYYDYVQKSEQDPEYLQWKIESAEFKTTADFEDWLKMKGKIK